MSALDDVTTVGLLAAKVGSHEQALALLRKLGVPVTDGVFSDRLLRARLEQGGRTKRDAADPVSAALDHLGRLGLIIAHVDLGRPTVLTLQSSETLIIGSREYEDDPPGSAFAPLRLSPGDKLRCVVQIARHRAGQGADFNVRFGGVRKKVDVPLYVFYLLDEDRCWVVKKAELEAFRDAAKRKGKVVAERRTFTFFQLERDDYWRISFAKGVNDFDSSLRVAKE